LNIAFKRGNDYICVYAGNRAKLSQGSILNITKPDLIMYTKLKKIGEDYRLQNCYEIKAEWLLDIAPNILKKLNEMKLK